MVTYINGITTLAENAAESHTNFNTAMYQLDALAQMSVISILDMTPGSPSDGDIYLVDYTPASQPWSGKGDNIAYYINSTDPEVRAEWIFVAPKEGMQLFLESDNVWLHYKGGTAGIGGGGWHSQYVTEISGHILEPYEGSSSQEHSFNLCLNENKKFEITSFYATLRNSSSPLDPPAASDLGELSAVLAVDGAADATSRIVETDLIENLGGGLYRYYALVSKTGLSIIVEQGETLALSIYDLSDEGDGYPENFRFSVHIREVQT